MYFSHWGETCGIRICLFEIKVFPVLHIVQQKMTCSCPLKKLYKLYIFSGLSLKIEAEGGNEKVEWGSGGLAYSYILFEMQK